MVYNLLDWTREYIRYKDCLFRKILEISADEQNNKLFVKNKDGSEDVYICFEHLEGNLEGKLDLINNAKVVCLNTSANFKWLTKKWDDLKKTRNTFIFVNPVLGESWSVYPRIHDLVTETSVLESGLKALFDTIPEVK